MDRNCLEQQNKPGPNFLSFKDNIAHSIEQTQTLQRSQNVGRCRESLHLEKSIPQQLMQGCKKRSVQFLALKQFQDIRPKLREITKSKHKELMILIHIISIAQENAAFECNYVLFQLPFLLILALALSHYSEGETNLYIHHLYLQVISKVQQLKKCQPKQLKESVCDDYLMIALGYKKGDKYANQIKQKLCQFLKCHKQQMQKFMQCYYLYFQLVAIKTELLSQNPTIEQIQNIIEKTMTGLSNKYVI